MPDAAPVTRTVPTRRISFDELDQVPRSFARSENVILCHLTAMMSAMFPDGEDFFVRSVRHYRDQITDPELKRQVTGFIGQESVHGREHRAFNRRLAELGYPTHRMERLTRRSLALRERVVPPIGNLALTAALEHFTATLAELVLSNEASRAEFGHPAVLDLFLWHALEESEHKAVAFDVYRAVGGSERTRIWTMQVLRFGFVVWTSLAVALSLAGDRATYRRGNLRRCWRELRRSPLVQRDVWLTLRDYCRRDFHPDDHDNRELLDQWRETLFGDHGTLVGKLATPAA
ncbi:MAG: metal-dependent hydrolase [Actinomycetota bacterium]|jgi:predicted metal-dependent hydrolase|nr:metal-dependent hydrolase [Actinomycetota bacterium]